MFITKDDRLAPISLLDLPDEVLQRIFRCLGDTYTPVKMNVPDNRAPPMSYLLLSKRLFPLVRDTWYRHVAVDANPYTREHQLASLALKPQAVLRAIESASVFFSADDTPLHYTFLAQLVNLQSLHIHGDPARGPIDTQSLQRLLDALPRLEEVELGDWPSGAIRIRLPDTVRSLGTPAFAFSSETLARLELRDLQIRFGRNDTASKTLPWEHLERLEMDFMTEHAVRALLAFARQTEKGTHASQLRSVTLNLLFSSGPAFHASRLLHGMFAKAAVESFDIFAVTPLAWEPLAVSRSIRKLEIYLPDGSLSKPFFLDGFYDFLRANPTLEELELGNDSDFVCDCWPDALACLLSREKDDLATHAPILFGLLHRIERSLGILSVRLYNRATCRGIKWSRSDASEEFVRDGFRR